MDWDFVWTILPITIFWRLAANETARWSRARQNGFRGASTNAGIAIDLIGGAANLAYYPWLIVTGLNMGWLETLAIASMSFVIGMILNGFIVGDKIAYWIIGLVTSPILAIYAYLVVL